MTDAELDQMADSAWKAAKLADHRGPILHAMRMVADALRRELAEVELQRDQNYFELEEARAGDAAGRAVLMTIRKRVGAIGDNRSLIVIVEELVGHLAVARRELAEAKADGERLDWYFTQRRYSVSIGSMGVLLHDDKPNERYATLIRYSEDSAAFPSVRAAIDAARKGE